MTQNNLGAAYWNRIVGNLAENLEAAIAAFTAVLTVYTREEFPEDFDAVLIPGGVANADKLRMDENARKFVRYMDRSNRPIAVICHGPWLLVSAGLVKGRHLTSYYTLQDDIRNAGGRWSDEAVVRDKNWVSSRKPDDIPVFNKTMIQLFADALKSQRVSSAEKTSPRKKGAASGR